MCVNSVEIKTFNTRNMGRLWVIVLVRKGVVLFDFGLARNGVKMVEFWFGLKRRVRLLFMSSIAFWVVMLCLGS